MRFHTNKQSGQILLLGLIVLAILIMMSGVILGYVALQLRAGRQAYVKAQATQIAEAGLDKALYELNVNSNFNGDASVTLPTGEFTTSVVTIDTTNKEITSTGYIPDDTNPVEQVTIKSKVTVNSSTVAFNYGVQVGAGGLQMSNNSTVNGNVFSDGSITGGNGAAITGDATVAGGGSSTADQQCSSSSGALDLNNVSNRVDAAQEFTPAVAGPLTKLSVYIKKTGNPSNITISIVTDSGSDTPSTNTIGGTGTIAGTAVTTSYGWIDVGFSTSPILTAGVPYWVVLNTSDTTSNYYTIAQSTDATCVTGVGSSYSANASAGSPVWTATNKDLNFKTYMGGIATLIDNVNVAGNGRANILTNCSITGNAYYNTVNTCSVTGTKFSGAADQAPQPLPISDAQVTAWEDTAESGTTITGPYTVVSDTFGPAVIDGDLIITGTLYLSGPVWVKGNITFGNNSAVRAAALLGNNGAILFADNPNDRVNSGFVDVSNNVIVAGNNNPGSYVMLLTTKSGDAMSIKNNASAAIFYAGNGTVAVANNAGGNQVTGFGIALQNNASITYSTGLQHATFANGPGGSWVFTKGTYLIAQ